MRSLQFLIPCLLLLLFSCKKDKLEGNHSILQGKWEWIGTTKSKTSKYYPDSTFWIPAANKSNNYFLEFEKRGYMSVWRDASEIKWYPLNIDFNRESGSPILTNERTLRIYLVYNETKKLGIKMNEDTMFVQCDHLKMPYVDYYKDLFHYSFRHTFVRIN